MVILLILTGFLFIAAWLAEQEVKGYRGAYGKGVWDEHSPYLSEAVEIRNELATISFLITVCWMIYLLH